MLIQRVGNFPVQFLHFSGENNPSQAPGNECLYPSWRKEKKKSNKNLQSFLSSKHYKKQAMNTRFRIKSLYEWIDTVKRLRKFMTSW